MSSTVTISKEEYDNLLIELEAHKGAAEIMARRVGRVDSLSMRLLLSEFEEASLQIHLDNVENWDTLGETNLRIGGGVAVDNASGLNYKFVIIAEKE